MTEKKMYDMNRIKIHDRHPLSFFNKKKKELTAMNSYANSDALLHTLGVVKGKETRRDE
jgi:hypothetical protein